MAPHIPIIAGVAAVGIGIAVYQNRKEIKEFVHEGVEDILFSVKLFIARRKLRKHVQEHEKNVIFVSEGKGFGIDNNETYSEKSNSDPDIVPLDYNSFAQHHEADSDTFRKRRIHNNLDGDEHYSRHGNTDKSIFYNDPEDDIWVVSRETPSKDSANGTFTNPFDSSEIRLRHETNPDLTRSWTEVEDNAIPASPVSGLTTPSRTSSRNSFSSYDRVGSEGCVSLD